MRALMVRYQPSVGDGDVVGVEVKVVVEVVVELVVELDTISGPNTTLDRKHNSKTKHKEI